MFSNKRDGARREDRSQVTSTGQHISGGAGGMHIGGDFTATSSVTGPTTTGATDEQRARLQDVLDAAATTNLWSRSEVRPHLLTIEEAAGQDALDVGAVRSALHTVEAHADTAGAVLAAIQVALQVLA